MLNTKSLSALLSKEFETEWRNKANLGGVVLYIVATFYICYLCFKRVIDPPAWNALFWVIIVFAAINAASKSFVMENRGRLLYMSSLASPVEIWLSKTIYNFILLTAVSLCGYAVYSLVIGNPVNDQVLYLISIILGCMGFAIILTTTSAISSKAQYNFSLMAILSFPMLIPFLITLIRFSKNAMDGLDWSISYKPVIVLLAINMIFVAISYVLIPYLWKD